MTVEVLSDHGRFAPLSADHPGVGTQCALCGGAFVVGDRVALVNGVPADAEEQAKYDAGRVCTLAAKLTHEDCAYPMLAVTP